MRGPRGRSGDAARAGLPDGADGRDRGRADGHRSVPPVASGDDRRGYVGDHAQHPRRAGPRPSRGPPARPGTAVEPTPTVIPAKLHVEEMGDGPPLVLTHGLGDSSDTWAKIVEPLASCYRL